MTLSANEGKDNEVTLVRFGRGRRAIATRKEMPLRACEGQEDESEPNETSELPVETVYSLPERAAEFASNSQAV